MNKQVIYFTSRDHERRY